MLQSEVELTIIAVLSNFNIVEDSYFFLEQGSPKFWCEIVLDTKSDFKQPS